MQSFSSWVNIYIRRKAWTVDISPRLALIVPKAAKILSSEIMSLVHKDDIILANIFWGAIKHGNQIKKWRVSAVIHICIWKENLWRWSSCAAGHFENISDILHLCSYVLNAYWFISTYCALVRQVNWLSWLSWPIFAVTYWLVEYLYLDVRHATVN